MISKNRLDLEAVAARHGHILERPLGERLRAPLILLALLVYGIYCWWFFAVGAVLSRADWSIAGAYLADWVSYESRPDLRIRPDGLIRISFPANDPLGENPDPEWLVAPRKTIDVQTIAPISQTSNPEASKTMSFMAPEQPSEPPVKPAEATPGAKTEDVAETAEIIFANGRSIRIAEGEALVTLDGESIRVAVGTGTGVTDRPSVLPAWATQKRPGEKIIVSFGMSGRAEISEDRVRIYKRFPGWANFLFDTNSAFFGMSTTDVIRAIAGGEDLKPGTPNWQLALNDIAYNPSWQHLDVWTKLAETVVMAFAGTALAAILSLPLSFLAARTITASGWVNTLTKRFFDFLRSVDMLIWALFFTRAFGPGPLAGISAIFITDTGTLGKLSAETLENIDHKQPEGVRSVGAPEIAVNRFGVLPQVLPVFASQVLYFWESNTRSATIIGAVGAGGIGLKLWEAMRTNANWDNVAYMVVLILAVVFLFDHLSSLLRARLIGVSREGR